MQQIADKLGISKVSVSKAINNQEGISQELRKKILSVAVEMGYMPKKKFTTTDKQDYKLAFFTPKRYFFENENFYSQIFYYLNKNVQTPIIRFPFLSSTRRMNTPASFRLST